MSLSDRLLKRYSGLVGRTLGHVRTLTARLSPRHDWVEVVRESLWRAVNPLSRPLGHPTAWTKGTADYVCTVPVDSEAIEEAIYPTYQRNLTSGKKARWIELDGELRLQWAVGSWVYDPPDTPWQHHVYLFPSRDGSTDAQSSPTDDDGNEASRMRGVDIYAHRETSVTVPHGHLNDPPVHGDPNYRVRVLLEQHGIEHEQRDFHSPYKPLPMKYSKRKKTMLAVAVSLAPTGMTMLVKGQTIEGGIIVAMAAGLMVLYDYYDDRAKGQPTLPEGVDTELLTALAEVGADSVDDLRESDSTDE